MYIESGDMPFGFGAVPMHTYRYFYIHTHFRFMKSCIFIILFITHSSENRSEHPCSYVTCMLVTGIHFTMHRKTVICANLLTQHAIQALPVAVIVPITTIEAEHGVEKFTYRLCPRMTL